MPIKYKVVPNTEIPKSQKKTSEARETLMKAIKELPKGKSVAINSADLKVKPSAITTMVYKLVRDKQLPKMKVQIRKEADKTTTIYISNI